MKAGADRAETDALRRRLAWAVGRCGRSQASVEGQLGVSSGFVSSLFSRRCRLVSLPLFRRLAAALRVRLAWLLCGDGPAWYVVRGEVIARRRVEVSRDAGVTFSLPSPVYAGEGGNAGEPWGGVTGDLRSARRYLGLGEARKAARARAGQSWLATSPRAVGVVPSAASLVRPRRAPAPPREGSPSARQARLRAELSAARAEIVRAGDEGDAERAECAAVRARELEARILQGL